jgi:hypothetical protein
VPAHPRVATTRRTALGGALVGLGAVAGCDLDPPGGNTRQPAATAPEDPDVALVEKVLAELTHLTDLVSTVRARFPRLREPLTTLEALHVGHREILGDEAATRPSRGDRRAEAVGPGEALALVRGRERRAQNLLADWSVAAESGALARLLACMSAGVAQQLATLPAAAGEDR